MAHVPGPASPRNASEPPGAMPTLAPDAPPERHERRSRDTAPEYKRLQFKPSTHTRKPAKQQAYRWKLHCRLQENDAVRDILMQMTIESSARCRHRYYPEPLVHGHGSEQTRFFIHSRTSWPICRRHTDYHEFRLQQISCRLN